MHHSFCMFLAYPPNCRLICICGFADAKRKAKLARKLHQKGAVGDRPSNFRDKTNVNVEAGVRRLLYLKLFYFLCQVINTCFILLCYLIDILYCITNLYSTACHLIHTVGDDAGKVVEFPHFFCNTLTAA